MVAPSLLWTIVAVPSVGTAWGPVADCPVLGSSAHIADSWLGSLTLGRARTQRCNHHHALGERHKSCGRIARAADASRLMRADIGHLEDRRPSHEFDEELCRNLDALNPIGSPARASTYGYDSCGCAANRRNGSAVGLRRSIRSTRGRGGAQLEPVGQNDAGEAAPGRH